MSLLERPILLLDGGLGTTLEDHHGAVFSSDTPLWSSHLLISSPSTLKQVHTAFADAGADIILTATYQASFAGFARTLVNAEPVSKANAERYLLSAVAIARSAFASRPGLVALSLGAYGATLVPSAEYSGLYGVQQEEDLAKFHHDRLSLFIHNQETWANIDLLAIETIPRLDEIRAARRVISRVPKHQRKPYWISCVFPNADPILPDGSEIPSIVDALLSGHDDDRPFAVGINCTKVHKLATLIAQFEDAILSAGQSFPRLVLYPDGASGLKYDTRLQKWMEIGDPLHATTGSWADDLFEIAIMAQNRGRWKGLIIGGCCKTAPTHIAKLHEMFNTRTTNDKDERS